MRPFPDVDGGQWLISAGGGSAPTWAFDGSELFYQEGSRMMAVSVQTDPIFAHGTPQVLFQGSHYISAGNGRNYDLAPDGRFLMMSRAQTGESRPQFNVVLNWFQELTERVPIN